MQTILVTGVAGFMGSHLADELLKQQYRVIGIDNLSSGYESNIPAGVKFYPCDLADVDSLHYVFDNQWIDYIFHLAAYPVEVLSHYTRRRNYLDNVMGSINLINCAINHEIKHFVFTSSTAVYGKNELPFHEALTPKPIDPYGISKWTIEQELAVAYAVFGMKYTIFRPHNVYGSRQNLNDKYRGVTAIFMRQAIQGKPLTIFGDGHQKRAFTHISDVVPCMVGTIQNELAVNQTFNIGADYVTTINHLAMLVCRVLKVPFASRHLEARHEVKEAYCDHQKALRLLGYKPKVSLTDGLSEMAAWAKKQNLKPYRDFQGMEINKNLPGGW